MREIELSQGFVSIVDDEYFEELNKYKWHVSKCANAFYAVRKTKRPERRTIYMHRVIMETPSHLYTDHIDGDGLNNRKENLRVVTNRQNSQNLHINASSIFPGVSWNDRDRKWQTSIRICGKKKNLGYFDVESDAYHAYLKALNEIGEACIHDIHSGKMDR